MSKKVIGVNLDEGLADVLEARAKAMNLSKSRYCAIVLQGWVSSGEPLVLKDME